MSRTVGSHPPEFWRLARVVEVTGLSKSEIYRQISEGMFPPSRAYKDAPTRRFWTSTEVQCWQAEQVGEDEWCALLGSTCAPDAYDSLLGSEPMGRAGGD